jgi:hypothetical protein
VGAAGFVAYKRDSKSTSRSDQSDMRNIFRALIAGYGAKKLGGGCITTVIIFIILFWLLGYLF